ncbi:MAG TPA: hypothetical protein GX509_00035 [Firmicutes bacterium]|nr:hypothetical protein [Bacillota bacterium]HHY97111.1 hypothetical protein [Bacillota bacterium]
MLSAEVSLYPMETMDSDDIINSSLKALSDHDLNYEVGPLSTRLSGPDESVWRGLRTLYDRAKNHGIEVAMVVTVANSKR